MIKIKSKKMSARLAVHFTAPYSLWALKHAHRACRGPVRAKSREPSLHARPPKGDVLGKHRARLKLKFVKGHSKK